MRLQAQTMLVFALAAAATAVGVGLAPDRSADAAPDQISPTQFEYTPNSVIEAANLAHDYWLDIGFPESRWTNNADWPIAAFQIGQFEFWKATARDRAWDDSFAWAEAVDYRPFATSTSPCVTTNPDHQAAGQVHFELAPIANTPSSTLNCLRQSVNTAIARSEQPDEWVWSWSDTLFMAPATWALLAQDVSTDAERQVIYEAI